MMENQLVLGCVGGQRRGGCGRVGDGGGRRQRSMAAAANDDDNDSGGGGLQTTTRVTEDDGGGRGWRLGTAVTGGGW
jgi:hypothetical protein